jgi:beta-glucosidase
LRKRKITIFLIIIIISGLFSSCDNSNVTKEILNGQQKAPTYNEQTKDLKALYNSKKSIDDNINVFLKEMTLQEKVGQMFQVERQAISFQEVKDFYIGSVFAGGGSTPDENTPDGWRKMTDKYKNIAKDTRLGIPLVFAVDAVHGNNNMKDAVIFPHNIALGASGDTELIYKVASATAFELVAAGVDWTFSPCIAVSNDIRWGRTYESFSENPDLVSIMSIPYITALEKQGIIACAKHYVADGAVQFGTGDSGYLMDQGNVKINQKELNDYYISVYREAVTAGVKTIMVSYSSINNIKNHGNRYLIQDILKDNIGFNGIVVSDYDGIHQLKGDTLYNKVVGSVNAGIDLLMESSSWKECYYGLIKAVGNKDIRMSRIDDAVSRILRVKMELGKFNVTEVKVNHDSSIRNSNNKVIAEEAVRKSLVLLKNENNILPLDKQKTIAVIGPASDNIGVQCGGWTKTWQGGQDTLLKGRWMSGTTVLDGFKEIASQNGKDIITDPAKLKDADIIVAVLGEYPYAEGKGDDGSLSIVQGTVLEGNEATLKAAYAAKKPVVVILVSGRPRIVTNDLKNWAGFTEAWLPGTEGSVIAKVLYGDYDFEARLPVTWPKDCKQLPMTVNNQVNGYDPLFSYGYGLNMKN